MNANEVIETYINDVAVRLPRLQRNDVAFELRGLLGEELQGWTQAAGCVADADMAIKMLRAFGHPADVAARYRPTLTIIDPADGIRFLRLSLIGMAIIWIAGLLAIFRQPAEGTSDLLGLLGQWWVGSVVHSLWWPGVLVVGFGLASRLRLRAPERSEWKPRSTDQVAGGRAGLVMAIVGNLVGLTILIDPSWILDVFFGSHAAPAAYEALSWSESFRALQAPLLFTLIALNVPVFVTVIAKRGWTPTLRRVQDGLGLLTCAVMAWAILDGPIMMATESNRTVKFCMVVIIAWTLLAFGVKIVRRVSPKPDQRVQVLR